MISPGDSVLSCDGGARRFRELFVTDFDLNHDESSSATMARTALRPAANESYSGASETQSEAEVTHVRRRRRPGWTRRSASVILRKMDRSNSANQETRFVSLLSL